jgi:hypothetical protein
LFLCCCCCCCCCNSLSCSTARTCRATAILVILTRKHQICRSVYDKFQHRVSHAQMVKLKRSAQRRWCYRSYKYYFTRSFLLFTDVLSHRNPRNGIKCRYNFRRLTGIQIRTVKHVPQ